MSFDFSSMPRKYATLTGKLWNYSGGNDMKELAKVTTTVSCTAHAELSQVRNWCQDNFGDNWIYNWCDFYFKYEADALMFKLKWS